METLDLADPVYALMKDFHLAYARGDTKVAGSLVMRLREYSVVLTEFCSNQAINGLYNCAHEQGKFLAQREEPNDLDP